MRFNLPELSLALLKTLGLLVFLEIVSTSLFPAIGLENIKLAFSVLIVLFLAFKLETPLLPFFILIIQYFHSIFSIEGWATGTVVGIIISLSVRFLKDLLQFSSAISTIIVVQIFQIIWFLLMAFILSLKLSSFEHFLNMFWQFVPESFLLSLLSPLFFNLLDRVWKIGSRGNGVGI